MQALAGTGTTITEVINVIKIEKDSFDDKVPMEQQEKSIHSAEVQTVLPAGREESQSIMYTIKAQPETCEWIKLNPSCFVSNRWGRPLSKATARKKKSRATGKILNTVLDLKRTAGVCFEGGYALSQSPYGLFKYWCHS